MKKIKIFKTNGFSLVEILIVVATIAIATSISGGLISQIVGIKQRFEFKAAMSSLRNTYTTFLKNDTHWQATINEVATNGTVMSCLAASTDCRTAETWPVNFAPFRDNGVNPPSLVNGYDPLTITNGYTMEGAVCNTFSTTTPTAQCPVHIDFEWEPNCPPLPEPCTQPEITVRMLFTFSFPTGFTTANTVNPAQLNFTFTRSGGFTKTFTTDCAAGEVVTGITASGETICEAATAPLRPW